ncbi:hypothetical protein M879_06395 [Mycobacteroides abscessus V06705]|nr:hypothetical protein M879_06395 [Mycobacteroides abscessus V06705]
MEVVQSIRAGGTPYDRTTRALGRRAVPIETG